MEHRIYSSSPPVEEHIFEGKCWCGAEVKEDDEGRPVVVHYDISAFFEDGLETSLTEH